MSFRFRKSIKILPGLKLNVGKTGIGVSTGIKGAHIGVNERGAYTDLGIPGTGISNVDYVGKAHPQTVKPSAKKNNHIFLKILFFPIWIEFQILILVFKMLIWSINFIFQVFSNDKPTHSESISPVAPEQQERIDSNQSGL